MGQRKSYNLCHIRVIEQDAVHFKRADFLATTIDDLFEAAREVQVAIHIKCSLISSSKPALATGFKEVLFIGLGVAFIAWRDVGTRNNHFTGTLD